MDSNAHDQDSDSGSPPPDDKTIDRRRFLEMGFWTSTSVAGVVLVGAGTRFVVGDSLVPKPEQWVQVGAIAELAAGQVHQATYLARHKDAWRSVERKGVLYVFSDDGQDYTVLDGMCTHLGCNVQWVDTRQCFHCPCHQGLFARAGDVIDGPAPRPLAKLQTKLENGVLFALI